MVYIGNIIKICYLKANYIRTIDASPLDLFVIISNMSNYGMKQSDRLVINSIFYIYFRKRSSLENLIQ